MKSLGRGLRAPFLAGAFLLSTASPPGCISALAQEEGPAPSPSSRSTQAGANAAQPPAGETAAGNEAPTFKAKVNLVLVRVVVRDAKGNAVGNLQKEDFQLFDQGKPQIIKEFTVEQAAKASPSQPAPAGAVPAEESEAPLSPTVPSRYVAYVFDDVHIAFGDLVRVRDAAARHLATLGPSDRAAIFTTSGRGNLDFTDDHTGLETALRQLQPHPITGGPAADCPAISPYQADLMLNSGECNGPSSSSGSRGAGSSPVGSSPVPPPDPAVRIATLEALACHNEDPGKALMEACRVARQVLDADQHESRVSLSVLKAVVQRMSVMPGQRTVLLLSPGFLTAEMEYAYDLLVEQALRAQVTISTLNGRGLYTIDTLGDITTQPVLTPGAIGQKMSLVQAAAIADEGILYQLAYGTGGSYFHNSNDFDQGFREVAAPPGYSYMLAFSPQNLKLNGKFHELKVTVRNASKLTIQARKGYFAPKQAANASQGAAQEIEEALFSQREMHDFPVSLQTEFSQSENAANRLAVSVHLDLKDMQFHHAGDLNTNSLTVVSGLFDHNGKFVAGQQKVVDMHIKDDNLAGALDSGVNVNFTFDVARGSYLVRLVVRNAAGELSTANESIEIP